MSNKTKIIKQYDLFKEYSAEIYHENKEIMEDDSLNLLTSTQLDSMEDNLKLAIHMVKKNGNNISGNNFEEAKNFLNKYDVT